MPFLIDARALTDQRPGGVTRVAKGLIEALIKTDTSSKFVLGTTGLGAQHTTSKTQHVHLPNKLVALATFLRLTSFDRLIPGSFDALFLPNLEMVGRPRIPYTLLVHDLSFLIEPRWFKPKTRLWHRLTRARDLIRHASALLAVSSRTRADLTHLLDIPPARIQLLPLASKLSPPEPLSQELASQPYFLVLGGNDPRKNAACVITAFEELAKNSPARLVVVGNMKCNTPQVTTITRPSDTLLATLMQHAAALLYPSWYEGFGLPLHEAAAFGTPIIASTSGALPETAPTGTIFVPPFKPHLWTQAMAAVLDTPRRTSTNLAADWSTSAQIVVDTLRRLVKNG